MAAGRPPAAVYVALAVAGAAVPLAAFLPWLDAHGLDAGEFVAELFANRISTFFALDVIVSAVVLVVFVAAEGARVPGRWLAVVATFLIGVSCGLPLFLALRERARRARP